MPPTLMPRESRDAPAHGVDEHANQPPVKAGAPASTCDWPPIVDRRAALRMTNAGEIEAIPAQEAEAVLPTDLLRDDEVVILLLRPSLLFIPLTSLGGLMGIVILTLILALFAATVNWIPWTEPHAYTFGAILICGRLGWQSLEWFNRIYVLTDRRIITRSGVLRVSVYETRLKFVQHTTVFRRLRERVCGLGSIGIATAGSDVFDTFWVMVTNPFAVHRVIVDTIHRYGRP